MLRVQTDLKCVNYLCLSADGSQLAVSGFPSEREVWAAPFGAANRVLKTNSPKWPGVEPLDGHRRWQQSGMGKLVFEQTGQLLDDGVLAKIPFLAVPRDLMFEDEDAPIPAEADLMDFFDLPEAHLIDFALGPDECLLATVTENDARPDSRSFLNGWTRASGTWEPLWAVSSDLFDARALAFLPNPARVVVVEQHYYNRDPERLNGIERSSLITLRDALTGDVIIDHSVPDLDDARWQQLAVGGREPVIVLGYANELRVYNPNDLGNYDNEPRVIPAEWTELRGMVFHPIGGGLLTVANGPRVLIWDTETWAVAREFDWGIGNLRSVGVSADGHLAAVGSDTGAVAVWDWEA